MARMFKSEQSMTLGVKFSTVFEDGSVNDHVFKIGDTVTDLRYISNGEIKKVSGRLAAIDYTVASKITWNKNNPSNTLINDITLTNLTIDTSTQYNASTEIVPVIEVVEWEDELDKEVSRIRIEPVVTYEIKLNYSDNTSSTVSVEVGDRFDNVKLFNPSDVENLITGTFTVAGFAYKLVNKAISVTGIAFRRDDNTFVISDFENIFALNELFTYDVTDASSLASTIANLANGDALSITSEIDTSGNALVFNTAKENVVNLEANLICDNSSSAGMQVSNGASVVVSGTAKFTTSTPYDSTHSTGIITVNSGGSLTFNGSGIDCVIADDPVNKGQFGVCTYGDCVCTVNDGDFKAGWYCLSGNGTYQSTYSNVTVNGGILVSVSDYAIYHPQKGKLTINGGIIDGAAGAIAMNSGDLEINGGTLQSLGTGDTGNASDGTGGLSNAVLYLNARYGDVTCKITGGRFHASGDAVLVATGTSHSVSIEISGGEFNTVLDSSWIAEGYHLTDEVNADGYYEVVAD